MGFFEGVGRLWQKARSADARPPVQFAIDRDHVDIGDALGEPFLPDQHYFQVKLNELFSKSARDWWQTHDPMVIVVSEFIYDHELKTLPYVVGPSMLKAQGIATPASMLFHDTRVAGLHPYKGGRINLAVVLYRLERSNMATNVLQVAEQAAGALDFSTTLTTYLKVAEKVLDKVDRLLGLDALSPTMGVRYELDPDANEDMRPGFFVLIDIQEDQLDRDRLWVREKRLVEGASLATAEPFRRADYVLWSLVQSSARTDLVTFPFHKVWERVQAEASVPIPAQFEITKTDFASLYQTMLTSPDLTRKHARAKKDEWQTEMKRINDEAGADANLGPAGEDDEADDLRAELLAILAL